MWLQLPCDVFFNSHEICYGEGRIQYELTRTPWLCDSILHNDNKDTANSWSVSACVCVQVFFVDNHMCVPCLQTCAGVLCLQSFEL